MTYADRGWRYRTGIGVRSFVALIGSYIVASLVAALLARTLPVDRISASIWGTLAGLLVPVPVALAAFLARSARRAALWTLIEIGVLAMSVWLVGGPA